MNNLQKLAMGVKAVRQIRASMGFRDRGVAVDRADLLVRWRVIAEERRQETVKAMNEAHGRVHQTPGAGIVLPKVA